MRRQLEEDDDDDFVPEAEPEPEKEKEKEANPPKKRRTGDPPLRKGKSKAKPRYYEETGAETQYKATKDLAVQELEREVDLRTYTKQDITLMEINERLAYIVQTLSRSTYVTVLYVILPTSILLFYSFIYNFPFSSIAISDCHKRTHHLVRQLRRENGLTSKMADQWHQENHAFLRVLCEDNEAYRDTIEVKKVRIHRYLPMNSINGMKLLFRVCFNYMLISAFNISLCSFHVSGVVLFMYLDLFLACISIRFF